MQPRGMFTKYLTVGLVVALTCLAWGADNRRGEGRATGKHLDIEAKLYNTKQDLQQVLGQKVEDDIVIVELTVTPRGDDPVKLWHDDFFLRSDKDGQRTEPSSPSQIAGSSVLTLVYTYEAQAVMQEDQGPVWGDPTTGRPQRLPGQGGGVGSGTTGAERAHAQVDDDRARKDSPLLATLKERVLQEGDLTEPIRGLLYFHMDGKHKVKHLELHYRGNEEKLDIRFKRPKN